MNYTAYRRSIDPHDVETDPAIDVTAALTALYDRRVSVYVEHTGGGNFVAGIGTRGEWDESQSLYRHDVNLGPFYLVGRERPGAFVGYADDLYVVFGDDRPSVTITSADHLRTVLADAVR